MTGTVKAQFDEFTAHLRQERKGMRSEENNGKEDGRREYKREREKQDHYHWTKTGKLFSSKQRKETVSNRKNVGRVKTFF